MNSFAFAAYDRTAIVRDDSELSAGDGLRQLDAPNARAAFRWQRLFRVLILKLATTRPASHLQHERTLPCLSGSRTSIEFCAAK
jgi:hypothetical protein